MLSKHFTLSICVQFAPSRLRRAKFVPFASVLVTGLLVLYLLAHVASVQIPGFTSRVARASYRHATPSFFPPSQSNSSDWCAGFPTGLLEDVQVVVKTGIGEIDRAKAHLATTSSCLRNAIIFSDVDQQVGEHHFIDILADLPTSYFYDNPDFATYVRQRELFASGQSVDYSSDGWKLDRFKFLPMVQRAYQERPEAKWYVFTEADVYIFWDSMFRLLHQYNPDDMLYLGSPVHGSHGRDFAYGGGGFVLSQGLMKQLVGKDGSSLAATYEEWARSDCCGDAILAYAIFDKTGVRLKSLYPMFSGEEISALSLDSWTWCMPIVSIHRTGPDVMEQLWRWERTRPHTQVGITLHKYLSNVLTELQAPLVFSDLLHYTHGQLRKKATWPAWDNLSRNAPSSSSSAHVSVDHCAKACHDHRTCLQYSYSNSKCQLGSHLMLGHAVEDAQAEVFSGWDMRKIRALGFRPEEEMNFSCKYTDWKTPEDTPVPQDT